jgi:hypothetical protein
VRVWSSQFLMRTGGSKRAAYCAVAVLAMLMVQACDKTPVKNDTDPQLDRPLVRTAESELGSGSVSLRFTVAPGDLPYQEKATVLVEVEADAGTVITIENYSDAIRGGDHRFELSAKEIEQKETVPQPDGRLAWIYRYELSFVLPGEYELPGAAVTYVTTPPTSDAENSEAAESPAGEPKSLSTEGVTVIAEATAAAAMTPEQLAQIEVLPPVEMKEKRSIWVWLGPLLAILAIALMVFLLRRARKAKPEVIVVIPAHEWADKAIARLVSEDLAGRGLIQEFHYRISDILRGYIERRYAVLAREMTTEEFLEAATRDARFDDSARGELDQFLRACDLVKYAKHQATTDDAESLLKTTRGFIARTRERIAAIAGADASNEGRAA